MPPPPPPPPFPFHREDKSTNEEIFNFFWDDYIPPRNFDVFNGNPDFQPAPIIYQDEGDFAPLVFQDEDEEEEAQPDPDPQPEEEAQPDPDPQSEEEAQPDSDPQPEEEAQPDSDSSAEGNPPPPPPYWPPDYTLDELGWHFPGEDRSVATTEAAHTLSTFGQNVAESNRSARINKARRVEEENKRRKEEGKEPLPVDRTLLPTDFIDHESCWGLSLKFLDVRRFIIRNGYDLEAVLYLWDERFYPDDEITVEVQDLDMKHFLREQMLRDPYRPPFEIVIRGAESKMEGEEDEEEEEEEVEGDEEEEERGDGDEDQN